MMKTKIFDLPRDLVEEIISRVPFTSMRAVRLTCKSWNKLSKSRSFSKMQLVKTEKSRMIVMRDYNLTSLYLVRIVDINRNPSRELLGKFTCLNDDDPKQVKILQVSYSEGLLLCILKDDIVVWNPYSGQTSWIKPRYRHKNLECYYNEYALGYVNKTKKNKSRRNYKILSLKGYDQIYDFDSDLWTSTDVTTTHDCKLYESEGVSLKGNIYWPVTKSVANRFIDHIICFDFTSERFGPLLRMPFNVGVYDYVSLSCVGEEKLAVSLINSFETNVWITTKIEVENVSWSKFLTLDTKPHCPIKSMRSFIDEDKKVVAGFSDWNHKEISIVGEAGYLRQLDLREPTDKKYSREYMCSYVPSLVQIKKKTKKLIEEAVYRRWKEKKTSLSLQTLILFFVL